MEHDESQVDEQVSFNDDASGFLERFEYDMYRVKPPADGIPFDEPSMQLVWEFRPHGGVAPTARCDCATTLPPGPWVERETPGEAGEEAM